MEEDAVHRPAAADPSAVLAAAPHPSEGAAPAVNAALPDSVSDTVCDALHQSPHARCPSVWLWQMPSLYN